MAKVKLNPVIMELSGAMGDLVFKKSCRGTQFVAMRAKKSNAEPSAAQRAQRERFAQANQYAKAIMADPHLRLVYEELAAQAGTSAFAMARSDYFKGNNMLASPHRPSP